MWQTSAAPKNLGVGVNFSAMQWRLFPLWASIVRGGVHIRCKQRGGSEPKKNSEGKSWRIRQRFIEFLLWPLTSEFLLQMTTALCARSAYSDRSWVRWLESSKRLKLRFYWWIGESFMIQIGRYQIIFPSCEKPQFLEFLPIWSMRDFSICLQNCNLSLFEPSANALS